MKKNLKIKVIKKNTLTITQTPLSEEKSLEKMTNRRMSSTISDWINEFQQRRYEETMLTFDQLLENNSRIIEPVKESV
jgi:hypothetical protein